MSSTIAQGTERDDSPTAEPGASSLSIEQMTFVLLSFEGPDGYSRAGGLGVRVTELSRALAARGATVHVLFVGDPVLPGREERMDGHLVLHRWCQWISTYHPGGVYDGEEDKLADFVVSAPWFIAEHIIRPSVDAGRLVVVLAEEWQTAEAVCRLHELLSGTGPLNDAVLLWNANNTMGFNRIDWTRLRMSAAITTVSRYMKHLLWAYGVNPLVIPNGIPQECLQPVDESDATAIRHALGERRVLAKVARFDPDKRWLLSLEALARLNARGRRTVMLARGGVEAHGGEVMHHARSLGLRVQDVEVRSDQLSEYVAAFSSADTADVVNLTTPMSQDVLRTLYRAADGVMANSGREPFGLVGLESMAAGGATYTGNTGEEYVRHLRNAIVLDTDRPEEVAWYVEYLADCPRHAEAIRNEAKSSAAQFAWDRVLDELLAKVAFLAARNLV